MPADLPTVLTGGSTAQLARRSRARSVSLSAENPTGAKGGGGRAIEGTGAVPGSRLGQGWKISPSIEIEPGETAVLGDVDGPGVIEHLWLTTHYSAWRSTVIRMYWDDAEAPAVEVPLGDFFCQGWGVFSQVSSQVVAVNPNGGFNAYWQMPFREHARITVENVGHERVVLYYQVDLAMGEVPEDALYLHAQWRRSRPVPVGDVHTLLDLAAGGHFAGCFLAWGTSRPGWWGEGEIKLYLDGDDEWPTICGTGTEDYVGGAWNFDVPGQGYTTYTTPYLGMHQALPPDGLYSSQQRFGMYRWHVLDPVRFETDLRVTIQALGIGPGLGNGLPHRYRQNPDDVASTTYLYLDVASLPDDQRPGIPDLEALEVG